MKYEYDRKTDAAGEPSLSEMTSKAIDQLSRDRDGFFLMVEAGRIDHAHHEGNAFRALTETVELSNAVRAAMRKVDLGETLIIVTADHSHTMAIQGYPIRGNNIFGLVREVGENGEPEPNYKRDRMGLPMTTLAYTNGLGYTGPLSLADLSARTAVRRNLFSVDTTAPDYLQEAGIPLTAETHGGEDVAIFAAGPNAHLVRGSMEQSWIFYVMAHAFRFTPT